MLCYYSWLDLNCIKHPDLPANSSVKGFQCDTEDFKKLFRKCQAEWRACVVWLADGNVWLWQNKRYVFRGGWQLALGNSPKSTKPQQLSLQFYKETTFESLKKKYDSRWGEAQ